MAKPSFIGIGAQKCASTWIYRVLEDHPEVAVSAPKELDFFSYHYERGFQWYERHFGEGPHIRARGELSPSYFCDPRAPERARRYEPELRLILALRDPVQRAYSNHLHEIRLGHFRGDDLGFEAGLQNNPMYLEQSRYARHLRRWLECFSLRRTLVLIQEEIERDPWGEARRLYAFLGVDPGHRSAFLHRRANPSYAERLPGVDALTRGLGRYARALGAGPLVEAVRNHPRVRALRDANRRPLTWDIPPPAPGTRERLEHELAADTLELTRLLGRPSLPWATWERAARAQPRREVLTP